MTPFDAEANVLGGCLIVSQAYWQVADLLTENDFASEAHCALWRAIGEAAKDGTPIDVFTVGDRNPSVAQLAVQVANATPGAANIRAYAEVVRREATTRRIRAAGGRIAKLAGEDVLGEAQRIIASCAPSVAAAIRPARDFLKDSMTRMAERHAATEVLTGVPTSIDGLDEMLSGWQRGDLILVGARPSVGKTALAVQASIHAALAGHPVLFLSLEMAGSQLTDRMLAHLARVDGQCIRQPKTLEESDWPRITAAAERIAAMPLRIDETSALAVEAVCARVRQANSAQRLGLVVIDYLTQMTPPKANRGDEAIQIITRALKALAKELAVPVMLLSQLNRAGDSRPSLTSLRESGAIEQDADVVLLLHRPQAERPELVECIVAKQRNGPIGDCWLHFNRPLQSFQTTQERPAASTVTKTRRGFGAPQPKPYWDDAA